MSVSRSEIINKISKNFPNLYKKDLNKLLEIIIFEITKALANNERVELRDVFSIEPKLKKSRYARNPKTNEKIYVKEKYLINLKISKFWLEKINEEK